MGESNQSPDPISAQLATMREQIAGLSRQVAGVDAKVGEVVALDKTLVALQVDYRHQAAEVAKQWERIDTANEAIADVDRKADQFINTARGAYGMLLFFWSVITAATLGGGAWLFNSVQETAKAVAVMQTRLERADRQPPPSIQRP